MRYCDGNTGVLDGMECNGMSAERLDTWERELLAELTAKLVEAAQEAKLERIKHDSLSRDEYREAAE